MSVKLADEFGWISVKDPTFGAVGDGSHDDTAAIQAALDYAFGPASSPHGLSNVYSNKNVFFPGGNYKITSALTLRSVRGARIIGAGRFATTINNTAANGSVFVTNGCDYSSFESMQLVFNGSGIGLDLSWDDTGSTSLQSNVVKDIYFQGDNKAGSTIGLRLGGGGFMGSETIIQGCEFILCAAGIYAANQNAEDNVVIGGNISQCGIGIHDGGGIFEISGTSFQQNTTCIKVDSGAIGGAYHVSGCRDENSITFYDNSVGTTFTIQGCGMTHDGLVSNNTQIFAKFINNGTFIANSVLDASIQSSGGAQLTGTGNEFFATDFITRQPFAGRTADAISSGFNNGLVTALQTFAQATMGQSASSSNEGAVSYISDGNTSTVGATVSGGGANHVWIKSTGSNWVVAGI